MQFTADRDALSKAVAAAGRAVSNRSTLPILSHLLMVADGERLTISATDLEIGIRAPVPLNPLDPITAGRTTLPARLAKEVIDAMPHGAVTVTIDEHAHATFTAGKSRLEINGLPADEFPPLPDVTDGTVLEVPGEALASAIGLVEIAVSADETRARLTGMQTIVNDDGLRLVATDTHRLATASLPLPSPSDEFKVIVPARAMRDVARACVDEPVTVKVTKSQVQFAFASGLTIVSRLIEGEFPNYRKVLPAEWAFSISGKVSVLRDAVRRAAIVGREDNRKLILTVSHDHVGIKAQSSKVGSSDEEVDGLQVRQLAADDSLQMAFNADYLLQGLDCCDDEFTFDLVAPNAPGLLRGAPLNWQYVAMPMQLV